MKCVSANVALVRERAKDVFFGSGKDTVDLYAASEVPPPEWFLSPSNRIVDAELARLLEMELNGWPYILFADVDGAVMSISREHMDKNIFDFKFIYKINRHGKGQMAGHGNSYITGAR